MSDRPPRDPDDLSLGGIVDEVVSQVRVALDEADVTSRQSRDLLLDGLRDVMQALDPSSLVRPKDAPPKPDVTVVDGGRPDDAPRTAGGKPDLKVAEPAADAEDPAGDPTDDAGEHATEDPASSRRVFTRVHVHRPARTSPGDGQPRVHLEPSGDASPAWQSLFRGSTARPYRITAEQGTVRVSLDGMPADTVAAGASLDVEARVIQVCATDQPATVRYVRLPA